MEEKRKKRKSLFYICSAVLTVIIFAIMIGCGCSCLMTLSSFAKTPLGIICLIGLPICLFSLFLVGRKIFLLHLEKEELEKEIETEESNEESEVEIVEFKESDEDNGEEPTKEEILNNNQKKRRVLYTLGIILVVITSLLIYIKCVYPCHCHCCHPYNQFEVGIDVDGDGVPDLNIDTNGDGLADLNVDKDGDGKPDLNVDEDGDGIPDKNIDFNWDTIPDINTDDDGKDPDDNKEDDNNNNDNKDDKPVTPPSNDDDDKDYREWSFEIDDVDITKDDEELKFNLFHTIKDTDGTEEEDVASGLIAPGTMGGFTFKLENTSDYDAKYTLTLDETNKRNVPIEYSIDGKNWHKDFSDINNSFSKIRIDKGERSDVTIQWRWAFDGDDIDDTSIGKESVQNRIAIIIKATFKVSSI